MELKWIEDFLSLSSTSSFSRAASERNITQSALSRRIRQLESWLGVQLFDRTSYPVRITPEGQAFLPCAHQTVTALQDARASLRQEQSEKAEVLTFVALNTLSLTFFPNCISLMERRIGPVKARLNGRPVAFLEIVTALVEGKCDFLLTYAHPHVPIRLDPGRFDYRRLGEEAVLPLSAPNERGEPRHRLVEDQPISYLSYGTTSFLARGLKHLFAGRPLPLTTVYENSMSTGLKAMALAGRGVAWIPESLVSAEIASGALVPAGDSSWNLTLDVRLYRASARARPTVERFWKAVTVEAKEPAVAN